MKYKHFENYLGDLVRVPYLENGHALCPICGEDWNGFEPFYGDRQPSDEICPECGTHFGNGDVPRKSQMPMTTSEYFQTVRLQWLRKRNWDETLLIRLRDVLGVDTAELLKDRDS